MNRLRAERGANLVEFAFALPILAALVFGIADFGVAFNDYISIRHGTRDAAREAVVANFGTTTSCALTGGSTGSSQTQGLMCLAKNRVGLADANTRVKVIVPSGYGTGDTLTVCTQYPLTSATNLFSPLLDGKQLKTAVKMRAEQVASNFTSGEETPPAGGDWSWCA